MTKEEKEHEKGIRKAIEATVWKRGTFRQALCNPQFWVEARKRGHDHVRYEECRCGKER